MSSSLLLVALGLVAAGTAGAAGRTTFRLGIAAQSAGLALAGIAGAWTLAAQSAVGASFSSALDVRFGVDGLTAFFLMTLGLVGAWVLCESLRGAWPFGGVPLSLLAVGQVAGPLAPIARIGGVLAIGAVTVMIGVALSAAFGRHYTKAVVVGTAAFAVLAVALIAPTGHPTGKTIDIALVRRLAMGRGPACDDRGL